VMGVHSDALVFWLGVGMEHHHVQIIGIPTAFAHLWTSPIGILTKFDGRRAAIGLEGRLGACMILQKF
jgi:hypothetical protein